MGNLSPIVSGLLMSTVSRLVAEKIPDREKAFATSLKVMSSFIVLAGGVVAVLYGWVMRAYEKEQLPPTPVDVENVPNTVEGVNPSAEKKGAAYYQPCNILVAYA